MSNLTVLLSGSDVKNNSAKARALDGVLSDLTSDWWVVTSQSPASMVSHPLTVRSLLAFAGVSTKQWCQLEESKLTIDVGEARVTVTGTNYPSPGVESQLIFYKVTRTQAAVVESLNMSKSQCEQMLALPEDLVEVCWRVNGPATLTHDPDCSLSDTVYFLHLASTLLQLGWESLSKDAKEIFAGLAPSWQGPWADLFQTAAKTAKLK